MRTLADAIAALRPAQREAILQAVHAADGADHVDDLAFVAQLLVDLMDLHEQTPVGWCIVTAHKALLKMAQNEGLLPAPPRVRNQPRPSRFDQMAADLDNSQAANRALTDELIKERRHHDSEVYDLRQEIQDLRDAIGRLDLPSPAKPAPTRVPGQGVLPYTRPSLLSRFWSRLRGGSV